MKNLNTTILEYVDWRGDVEFSYDGINEVDCLIFSTLSYFDFSKAPFTDTVNYKSAPTLGEVYTHLKNINFFFKEYEPLFRKCASSKRFAGVRVFAYESVTDLSEKTQFAAVSFLVDNKVLVTFRGTDDTIVGWQEDLLLSFEEIPAQRYAAHYVNNVAFYTTDLKLYITGHSKGGNLAIWAGAHLDDKYYDRLEQIYDYDGPGFCCDFTDSDGFKKMDKKAVKFVVDSSIVGMLLDSETKTKVVMSRDHTAMAQHNPMSWLVRGTQFVYMSERSTRGKATEAIIKEWLSELSFSERKKITKIIIELMDSSNAKTLSDFMSIDAVTKLVPMLKTYAETHKVQKQFLSDVTSKLTNVIKKRATGVFDNLLEERKK